MPAFYAHSRFGAKVAERMKGELREIIRKHYRQFEIGLQGRICIFFIELMGAIPYQNMEFIYMGFLPDLFWSMVWRWFAK